MSIRDLLRALKNPLHDPREKLPAPVFRSGILKIEDLKPGQQLRGQVVNVVDFGIFVNIGIGDSCLVHISRLSNRFIRDPHWHFAVGDVLDVWVQEVDSGKNRVTLTAVQPDLRLSRFDPFGLRYTATLLVLIGVLFGSITRVGSLSDLGPASGAALAAGPAWEVWIEPPSYTGKPTLYLNDQTQDVLEIAQGSTVMLRLYGEVGALTVAETVSGRTEDLPSAAAPEQAFE